jgi:hypothetical protein
MENKFKKIKIYTEALKQLVLSEVKAGFSVAQVSEKYGIEGHMTVYRWCKKYGIISLGREVIDVPLELSLTIDKEELMSKKKAQKEKEQSQKSMEDRLKLMEYELALYKKLVEIAKRDYDLDLIKKLNTKPSEK